MKIAIKPASLIGMLLLAAACNKAPTDVVPQDAAELPAAAEPSTEPAAERADITITPVPTDDCKPRRYTAEIAWSVPGSLPHVELEVRVSKPDGGLMAYKKGRNASAMTGNWVSPGVPFYLVDRTTKEVVAQATSGPYDCQ